MALALVGDDRARVGSTIAGKLRRTIPGARTVTIENLDDAEIVWVTTGSLPDRAKLEQAVGAAELRRLHVGISDIATGPVGFTVVGHEALDTARAIAQLQPGEGVANFRQTAPITTLLADRRRATRFARVVLGPLSSSGEEAARLRETRAVYFSCGASKTAAGARLHLHLHEKTVGYRPPSRDETGRLLDR